ncbi:shikimate dehydrogenase [uncultured Paraglaciecola sp.]|jgi:shikimate dehydrogenase|uniref:shikimate dehydrogenase n=1 Tax=uncultured Paraglaciecola sp. TaxID=1765024 RepID=UPI002626DF7E|nr:shikimate dehydrogenase [uncultured Paraglaciecola sp.]
MVIVSKYTVFGNPIAQSKSPAIHAMFAQQAGLIIEYDRTFATQESFIPALINFFNDADAKGCNVTSPFKEQVAKWVNDLSPAATIAGSVNTVIRKEDGTFLGDTTDGKGLVQDFDRLNLPVEGARILLLGAGGAARGVLQSILALEPSLLMIANRTEKKAVQLASLIPQENFVGAALNQLNEVRQPFDLIINSTSASLTGELPTIPDSVIRRSPNVYDMSYADKPTVFLQHAKKLGVLNTFDGLGMLVGQAAESFYLWTGYRPDVSPVIDKLRRSL